MLHNRTAAQPHVRPCTHACNVSTLHAHCVHARRARCAGTDLAQALSAKESIARKKAAMSGDVAKSLARLSTGLYVVTAQHNNARSAMVASWVSQVGAARRLEPQGRLQCC